MPPMALGSAILNLMREASLPIGGEAYRVERWSIARAGLGSHRLVEQVNWTKGGLDGADALREDPIFMRRFRKGLLEYSAYILRNSSAPATSSWINHGEW
jgi:hypothetical protein